MIGVEVPLTIDRNLPLNVLVFTPLNRRIGSPRNSRGIGTSPLRPVVCEGITEGEYLEEEQQKACVQGGFVFMFGISTR